MTEAHKIYIYKVKTGKRGVLYDAEFDGEVICQSTMTPLLDACRVLRSRGVSGPVEMWDHERPFPRMLSTVEAGAGLAVIDTGSGPRFVKWREKAAGEAQDGDLEEAM